MPSIVIRSLSSKKFLNHITANWFNSIVIFLQFCRPCCNLCITAPYKVKKKKKCSLIWPPGSSGYLLPQRRCCKGTASENCMKIQRDADQFFKPFLFIWTTQSMYMHMWYIPHPLLLICLNEVFFLPVYQCMYVS